MGVFDFVREAGAKIGFGDGADDKAAPSGGSAAEVAAKAAAEAKAASDDRAAEIADRVKNRKSAQARADRMERIEESKKARGLEKYVKDLGFEVENLDVRFDDGRATVSGKVADQATREKIILAIGNTEDVGQVEDDIEIAEPAEESEFHVVVRGDTLSKIALAHYGDASKYPVIFEANRPMLTNPDLIYPGQVLRIPEQ